MEDDNNEFFDLLNRTQQSFYDTLNNSMYNYGGGTNADVDKTFYSGMI